MNISDPDYPIDGSEDIINIADVKNRIDKLLPFHVEFGVGIRTAPAAFVSRSQAQTWVNDNPLQIIEYSEELDERNDLKALLDNLGDISSDSYLVNDSHMVEYVEDTSDLSPDDPIFSYVDWERAARDYSEGLSSVNFRGSKFWIMER